MGSQVTNRLACEPKMRSNEGVTLGVVYSFCLNISYKNCNIRNETIKILVWQNSIDNHPLPFPRFFFTRTERSVEVYRSRNLHPLYPQIIIRELKGDNC